ncbi:regulator of RNase E activity RraA [Rhizobium sp. BK196]|jgi:4-hydroxy-4-methyl-2-oxoglutarate aldolase|uniref:RraA family protein n=1 Tax=Rhizobium sp. BK196 TaxID=2587073 RepID=UPI00160F1B54|nr:RraA family protein [Rhizobium sp. BK196]MBB3313372.1 regulator of RNase E activity RraA [Rhizobium sp. BK196]
MTPFYRAYERQLSLPPDLIDMLPAVETATIGHVEHLGFVGDNVRPVFPCRAFGPALTVAAPGRDGVIIYKAVDMLKPGDMLVISRVDRDDVACVGGGVAAAAKAKGASGIVIDGPCTDVEELVAVGLPIWCRGVSSRTTNRIFSIGGSINVPVACGSAAILPGYAVLADSEGVFAAEAERMHALAEMAIARQQRSAALRAHLTAGKSIFLFEQEDLA